VSHGKHRKRRWNAEHMIPRKPVWMDETTYRALAKLRTELEAA
jgi:hypothetical protein